MHEMEEGVRSVQSVVKKKSSSGCLIIKRKGVGTSGPSRVYESNEEKKRSLLVVRDDYESGEEFLEPFQRKAASGAAKYRNGSVGCCKYIVGDSRFSGNGVIENDRKRTSDMFEFDEYDGVDGKRMRNDYFQDRIKFGGSKREFETGPSRHGQFEKRQHSYFERATSPPNYPAKDRFELEDEEPQLPIPLLRQKFHAPSDKPIRLQGKNGVLKVMVNKRKNIEQPHRFYDYRLEGEDINVSKSEHAVKERLSIGSSSYSDSKHSERSIPFDRKEKSELKPWKTLSSSARTVINSETVDNDSSLRPSIGPSSYSDCKRPEKSIPFDRKQKSEIKLQKLLSSGVKTATNSEIMDNDLTFRQGKTSIQAHGPSKRVKSEGKDKSVDKTITAGANEEKVKRGQGTEKQLLRQKIREMLVNAGWTIDYRPRRNRDYLDAVYINPAGTAYWSIIKAYDAFQKQMEEDGDKIKQLPDELLGKLTRKTRKKIEKEMKMKQRSDSRNKNVKWVAKEESADGSDGNEDDDQPVTEKSVKSSKGRSNGISCAGRDGSSETLYKGLKKQGRLEKPSGVTNTHMIQARNSKKFGRCALVVRGLDKGQNLESDGYVPYSGKRTLLSWLIDSGMVHLSQKVQYMNRRQTRVMLEGWITRDGIHCGCCSKILTVSKFEIHAGSKLRQPFQNIYLESGVSLLQCQIDAWNRQEASKHRGFHTVDIIGDDPNDDTCGICGDGGDLICCDGCPSTFHQSCLDIEMLPAGDWHCTNCTCKFCGIVNGNGTPVDMLLVCSLCGKKYHESCGKERDALPSHSNHSCISFCGQECQELFDQLQKLVGVKHELESGFSWSLLHQTDLSLDVSHRGFPQRVECNSKLAVALSVMDECFMPVVDRRSGVNLIHNVLHNFGSNLSRLNFSGFYTAVLERGDEIISAASIRIHGAQLAEMPFIGTRHIYRRQGMCHRLLSAIELVLCSLKVEKLIIPAIPEHMLTWTRVFGFNPLEESHKQELKLMNMLVFPGTDMLQKLLMEQKSPMGEMPSNSGAKSTDSTRELAKGSGNSFDDNSEIKLLDSSKQNTALNSMSEGKLTDNSADLKRPPPSNEDHAQLEEENSEPDASIEIRSSLDGIVDGVQEVNAKVSALEPVYDLLSGTLTVETAKEILGYQNSLSLSLTNGIDEITLNSELGPQSALDMECKPNVGPEVPYEAKVECLGGQDSFNGISVQNSAEQIGDLVSLSSHVIDQCVVQYDLSEPDRLVKERKINVAPQSSDMDVASEAESSSNAASEVAADEEAAQVGNNISSNTENNVGKYACEVTVLVKPFFNSLGDIPAENRSEDAKENVADSRLHGSDDNAVHYECDQNRERS